MRLVCAMFWLLCRRMQRISVDDGIGPTARGFAQSGVRLANERTIMTLIALNPGASNADLARQSGLGPQTTSRIVTDLETRELVLRGEVLRGRRGQPATPLFLNPDGAFAIGVEIGWRHFEVLLFSMAGQTLASIRRSYAWPDFRTIFANVAAEIATIRAGMTEQQAGRLAGIGLATPPISRGIWAASARPPNRWNYGAMPTPPWN
ncbi:ROK family transcriptional regulator [Devosia ginsengisoli]|uniref:ROK family transcriptional regulator n=2 Tax=Devosia ginsengisoli TaxID=400770 RepID=A0A5B8LPM4_9HYPH|nr:ROK family transcriptional regulator [Devosia ginsengisoli]